MKRYNFFRQLPYAVCLFTLVLFAVSCSEGPLAPVNSNNPLVADQNQNSTGAVRPVPRRTAGNSLAKLVSYNTKAVLHLQDLIDELQYVSVNNGNATTRTKATNAIGSIVAAQNELKKTAPNKSLAFSQLNTAMTTVSGMMSDNSLNSTTVNQFLNEINAALDILNIGGTINHDCRGLTKYLFMKKADGGVLAFCGHKFVIPKNALQSDANMFINIDTGSFITIDCGPDGTFSTNVEVYVSYRDANMTGINVNTLTLAWYNTATTQWINLGGTPNTVAQNVKSVNNHFTKYTISTN